MPSKNTICKTAISLIASKALYPIECGQAHKSGAVFFRGRVYLAEWSPLGLKVRSERGTQSMAESIREQSRWRSQF